MAVGVIMLLVVSSAYYPAGSDSLVGADAPDLELVNKYDEFSLKEFKGDYVLLSFWSSTDPRSRIANKAYNDFAGKRADDLKYVSVNFDPSSGVFEELIKVDGLSGSNQYHIDGMKNRIFSDYNLRQGYASYLVAPDGVVVAMNPTVDELSDLVES